MWSFIVCLTARCRERETEQIRNPDEEDGHYFYHLLLGGLGAFTVSSNKRAISAFSFPCSFSKGSSRLSGRSIAARRGTGLAPGRVTTPQRTPRTSSIHSANSTALPIVADNKRSRIRGGVRIIASSQTWPRS